MPVGSMAPRVLSGMPGAEQHLLAACQDLFQKQSSCRLQYRESRDAYEEVLGSRTRTDRRVARTVLMQPLPTSLQRRNGPHLLPS